MSKNNKVSRRVFLGGTAAAGAGAALLGYRSCTSEFDFDPRADFPVVPENKVSLPKNGKSVLILGGGFGGMHAACELLDRGFEVTIIEKSSMLGGKMKSWRDKTFGVPPLDDPNWPGYPHDHGAHAVWGFYNNLREFMGRHDFSLWVPPDDVTMYNFMDRDGDLFKLQPSASLSRNPFTGLQQKIRELQTLPFLNSDEKKALIPALLKIASFDMSSERDRMYLDSVSFPEYARSLGMPEEAIYRFFAPIAEMAMFDHIDHTSALYLLTIIHLVIGHPQDWDIDLFFHPPGETYVAPITEYILKKGGKIVFDTPVVRINRDKGKVRSVTAGEEGIAGPPGVLTWKCNICGSVFAASVKPGRCPVCGAPQDQIRPLSGMGSKDYAADYYILAMETKAAKDVLKASQLSGDPYYDNIQKLDSTSVFVVNLWYDDPKPFRRRVPGQVCFFTSHFRYIGITLDWAIPYHRPGSGPLVPDYQGKNISVIETQIANTDHLAGMTDEDVVKLAQAELEIAVPGLKKPLDYYVNRWDTYSPQRTGYEAHRPKVQSPLDNLMVIGDWVRTDHLSVYMEKTQVSAKMAVNLIMEKIGRPEHKLRVLPSGSPNLLVDAQRLLMSPKP